MSSRMLKLGQIKTRMDKLGRLKTIPHQRGKMHTMISWEQNTNVRKLSFVSVTILRLSSFVIYAPFLDTKFKSDNFTLSAV